MEKAALICILPYAKRYENREMADRVDESYFRSNPLKKGDLQLYSKYRTTALINHESKIANLVPNPFQEQMITFRLER